jgi:putative hydrolase of the HAD superfamily
VAVIVFDVDDTLYLERDYVFSGIRAVGRHLEIWGIDGFTEAAWRQFLQGARGDLFDRALHELSVAADPQLVPSLVDVYRTHKPDIELLPDAANVLERCAREGHDIGIITDGPAMSQRSKLAALALNRLTATVLVTAEHGPTWHKPSEKPFRAMERVYGSGQAFLYVADNPAKDFEAPARLGWRTYRVRRSGSLHVDVPSGSSVDHEAHDLSHFLEWLSAQRQGE